MSEALGEAEYSLGERRRLLNANVMELDNGWVRGKKQRWVGRVLSGAAIAFLLMDGAIKLVPIAAVSETLSQLGYSTTPGFERGLGSLGLACTLLYAVPRTSVLGAILLTGYLGGAIAAQLRVGNPVFSHLLFGGYLGLAVWGGLWLRTTALRSILPFNVNGRLVS